MRQHTDTPTEWIGVLGSCPLTSGIGLAPPAELATDSEQGAPSRSQNSKHATSGNGHNAERGSESLRKNSEIDDSKLRHNLSSPKMQSEVRHLRVRDTLLAVSTCGSGSAVVMLVHGLADNGACWAPLVRELASKYRLIVPDLRGHGASAAPTEGWAPAEQGEDLIGVLDELGIERATLVGHSLGADAACHAAMSHPHRVVSLVLEDPPWGIEWERYDDAQRMSLARMWLNKLRGLAELSDEELECIARDHCPKWTSEDREAWKRAKREVRFNVVRSFLAPRPPWQTVVRQLSCPTLLLTGDPTCGAIVPSELAREASQLNLRLQVASVASAGHSIRRDDFASYCRSLVDFLAESLEDSSTTRYAVVKEPS